MREGIKEEEKEGVEQRGAEEELSMVSEGVSEEYALLSTVHYEEKGEEQEAEEEKPDEM